MPIAGLSEPLLRRQRLVLELELRSFEQSLNKLAANDYPTDVGPALLNELFSQLHAQRAEIDYIDTLVDDDPKNAGRQFQSERRKLSLQIQLLYSLDNAQTSKVPWSFIASIEKLAQELLPHHKVLTTCTESQTYTIQYVPDEHVDGIEAFDVLEIPQSHRLDAPLHVLVGHELLHPTLPEYLRERSTEVLHRLKAPCEGVIKKRHPDLAKPSLFNPLGSDPLGTVIEQAREIWQRAMEELICDMGCAVIFGPSTLLALYQEAQFMSLDLPIEAGNLHPPFRFRLRTLLERSFGTSPGSESLEELRRTLDDAHRTPLDNFLNFLKAEVAKDSDKKIIEGDPLTKIAYDQVALEIEAASNYIQSFLRERDLCWANTIDEVPHILKRFEMLVPAGQIEFEEGRGRAASTSSLALAGWLDSLRRESEGEISLDSHLRACRLLLKSWEDSELIRGFERKFVSEEVPSK